MYSDIVIDSNAPNVQQIAEEKTKYNARNPLATLGIVSRSTAREDNKLPEIKLKSTVFIPLYTTMGGWPNRYLIVGQGLCGKSTLCGLLAKSYKKQYKENEVFVFSSLESDKALDICKPKRIMIDESFIDDPIELPELANSLCIFDDLHDITDKELLKTVLALRDKIYSMGRHHNIAIISSDQLAFKGHESKGIMTNSFVFIMFPIVSKYQCVQFLTRYMFLPKEQIHKICDLKSRFVLINKNNPLYVLHEHGFFYL